VHTRFIQAGAATGRMASENPNMQNIPVSSEHGKNVRRAFLAPPGKKLLSLDYSQVELRIAAMMSGDEKLIEIFKEGRDVHSAVAARVFRKKEEEVTKEERRAAKAINFGVIYGMGANALRQSLAQGGNTVTQADANQYLDDYFAAFAKLSIFLDETKASAARKGYTETMFGRRRYLDGLASRIPYIRAAAERMALNAPLQGTGADIVKIAIIRVDQVLKDRKLDKKAVLLLQVHDELVYEVDEKAVREVATVIKETMESVIPKEKTHGVSLEVGVSVGNNWEELESVSIV
jgi:DNA polymerase-1